MPFLDVEQVGIGLRVRAQERAMRQIGRPNFRARQMLRISEVQLVGAVVEHVNHFVCQHTLHKAGRRRRILANDDLVELGVVAAGDRIIAYLA